MMYLTHLPNDLYAIISLTLQNHQYIGAKLDMLVVVVWYILLHVNSHAQNKRCAINLVNIEIPMDFPLQ